MELLIAIGIFAFFITAAGSAGVNFYNTQNHEKIRNTLIEESQFLMNRISDLVRNNAIDYSEYFSNGCSDLGVGNFGIDDSNYCDSWENPIEYGNEVQEYEARFIFFPDCDPGDSPFDSPPSCSRDDDEAFHEGYFDTGADNISGNDVKTSSALRVPSSSLTPYHQWELYLISGDGKRKTMLRRIHNGIDDNGDGFIDGGGIDGDDGYDRLGIYEMVIADTDSNGLYDSYVVDSENYQSDTFIPISPPLLEIVDLRFFVAPLDDPRKAFRESGEDIQIQPHVTILMTVRPNKKVRNRLPGGDNSMTMTLQTTISSRILKNVLFPES